MGERQSEAIHWAGTPSDTADMPNHRFRTLAVVGINPETGNQAPIQRAHQRAQALLGVAVTPLSKVGHNFIQSFFVHPSGGGVGREALAEHDRGMDELIRFVRALDLEFVETQWGDDLDPRIVSSHEDPASPAPKKTEPGIAFGMG